MDAASGEEARELYASVGWSAYDAANPTRLRRESLGITEGTGMPPGHVRTFLRFR